VKMVGGGGDGLPQWSSSYPYAGPRKQ